MTIINPFAAAAPRVFTIPAGAPFLPSLAAGLHAALDDPNDPLALSRALVLVPTRRAAQVLAEAFAKLSGGAALPPRIAPLVIWRSKTIRRRCMARLWPSRPPSIR